MDHIFNIVMLLETWMLVETYGSCIFGILMLSETYESYIFDILMLSETYGSCRFGILMLLEKYGSYIWYIDAIRDIWIIYLIS